MNETESVTTPIADYRVKLIGVLRSAAGGREIDIEGPAGLRLSELIARLLAKIDRPQFKELLIDSSTNSPLPNVIILLDDQDCNLFQGLRTVLDLGTRITIIPVAHGG